MLWVWISAWVVGASLMVFSFGFGVSLRRWTLAIVLFVAGAVLVGSAAMVGHGMDQQAHGIRVDETS